MSFVTTYATYLFVNFLLWLFILLTLRPKKKSLAISTKMGGMLLASTFLVLGVWLSYVFATVGPLPYGQDTAVYTYIWSYLQNHNFWDLTIAANTDLYYSLFHTSAITAYTVGSITSSFTFGYPLYLFALLFCIPLFAYSISSRLGANPYLATALTCIIFLATPTLGGTDAIQMYASSVFALLTVAVALKFGLQLKALPILALAAFEAVATHPTSVAILLGILLPLFLTRKRVAGSSYTRNWRQHQKLIVVLVAAVAIATYASYHYTASWLAPRLLRVIEGVLGNIIIKMSMSKTGPIITLAYQEIPSSVIWTYSWTLLPALGAAYVVRELFFASGRGNVLKRAYWKLRTSPVFGMTCFACTVIALVTFLRFLGIDYYKYGTVPSYFVLLIVSVATLAKLFGGMDRRRVSSILGALALLVVLGLGVYSGVQDPNRVPLNGGSRLAPVTYANRVELAPIAVYSAPRVWLFGYHDVYLPQELTNATIEGGGNYYVTENILRKVAKGTNTTYIIGPPPDVEMYFVFSRTELTNDAYATYNVVFAGNEHSLLVLP